MDNKKTISKNFKDDEIIGRLPNGDLYLKPGVRRIKKGSINDYDVQDQFNYDLINVNKINAKRLMNQDFKAFEGEIDNWE
jgi:hypothetical protein